MPIHAKLSKLANSSPLATATFKLLATRERPRITSDLTRVRHKVTDEAGLAAPLDKFLEIFKALQALGMGRIEMPERPGNSHKFHWECNHITMARDALDMPLAPKEERKSGLDKWPGFKFPTSQGNVYIPDGMSADEIDALVGFVQRLKPAGARRRSAQ